jgi:hypothetical protein
MKDYRAEAGKWNRLVPGDLGPLASRVLLPLALALSQWLWWRQTDRSAWDLWPAAVLVVLAFFALGQIYVSRRSAGRGADPQGLPLRLDPVATSGSGKLPAFLARPDDAPVYHGFPIVESSLSDGFRLGMITDFLSQPSNYGDAFVVAPDDTRAGLVWESEVDSAYFTEVLAPDEHRWGVWAAGTERSLRSEEDAAAFLQSLLPDLRPRWQVWKDSR